MSNNGHTQSRMAVNALGPHFNSSVDDVLHRLTQRPQCIVDSEADALLNVRRHSKARLVNGKTV